MKKALKVIERVFLIIVYIIGVLELAFLIWGAVMLYDKETLHFNEWYIYERSFVPGDSEKNDKFLNNKEEGNYVVEALSIGHGSSYYDQALCYNEIEEPVNNYSMGVVEKYEYKANLHIKVEYTPKTFTVNFTGWGYPDEGEPECLDRTYIFDIEGVGKDKLPVMLNKDEYFS